MVYEIVYHFHYQQLLDYDFLKNFSFREIIKLYNQLQKVLRKHYFNQSIVISRLMAFYVSVKNEKETKENFNPFSESDSNTEVLLSELDSISCSCLYYSIASSKIPKWALDLINYDLIKSSKDDNTRSSERFLITNGLILLDPFIIKSNLYCPMGIFDYERIEKYIKNDCLNVYNYNKEYVCTVKLDEALKSEIGLFQFKAEYTTIIGNIKLEVVKRAT
jgi:hypothetical protein